MSETKLEYLIHLWGRVKARLYTKVLSSSFFGVGEGTRILPPFRFYNLLQMQLGKNAIIHRNCWIQVLKDEDEEKAPKLIIGDFTTLEWMQQFH